MMDYYSTFSGPSRTQAQQELSGYLGPIFERDYVPNAEIATPRIQLRVRELIENILLPDKVMEILRQKNPQYDDNQDSFAGSATGWGVFGRRDCEDLIRRALEEQINEYKVSLRKKSAVKVVKKVLDNKLHNHNVSDADIAEPIMKNMKNMKN